MHHQSVDPMTLAKVVRHVLQTLQEINIFSQINIFFICNVILYMVPFSDFNKGNIVSFLGFPNNYIDSMNQ